MTSPYRIYLAAPTYSSAELRYNDDIARVIRDAYEDRVDLYLSQEENAFEDKLYYACPQKIAYQQSKYILTSELVVAVLDGQTIDPGVALTVGMAYQARIPVVGLYSDDRQYGVHGSEKINALKQGQGHMYHYVDPLVLGVIKQIGGLASDTSELIEEINLYAFDNFDAYATRLDNPGYYAHIMYGLSAEPSLSLQDITYHFISRDGSRLHYQIPYGESSTDCLLTKSFKNFKSKGVGEQAGLTYCLLYQDRQAKEIQDFHDPKCAPYTYEFYVKVFNLFLDLIEHYRGDEELELSIENIIAFKEHQDESLLWEELIGFSNLLEKYTQSPQAFFDELREVVFPRLADTYDRQYEIDKVIDQERPYFTGKILTKKQKTHIQDTADRLLLGFMREVIHSVAGSYERLCEKLD